MAPATVPVLGEPIAPTAQSRAEMYDKYYASPASTPPVTVADNAPAAEPVVPAATPAPVAPLGAAAIADYNTRIAKLEQDLAAANARTAAPSAPSTPSAPDPAFFDLIREGKLDEAEALMARRVSAKLTTELESRLSRERESAVAQSALERKVDEFLTSLKSQNQHLEPLEQLIAMRAQRRITDAQTAGRVKSASDYFQIYKESVLAEVEEANKLVQHYRGAGKTEALTTRTEVLNSTPLRPSTVEHHGAPAASEMPTLETPSDYLASRQARMASFRGLRVS